MTPSLFADAALWGLILGLLTPLVTAVAQQPWFSHRTRQIVGVVVSVIVGLVTVLAQGEIGNTPVTVTTVLAVIVAAQAAYTRLWQPSHLTERIEWTTFLGKPGRR